MNTFNKNREFGLFLKNDVTNCDTLMVKARTTLRTSLCCLKLNLVEGKSIGCQGVMYAGDPVFIIKKEALNHNYYMHEQCALDGGLKIGSKIVRIGFKWKVVEQDPTIIVHNRSLAGVTFDEIRTQKAAGIAQLLANRFYGEHFTPTTMLIQSDADVEHVREGVFNLGVKARPCPKRPRHGGVPSRVVTNKDELRAVWQRAKEEDPEAEVLLQVNIDAAQNFILTSSTLSYGPGCDGATIGKDSRLLRLGPGRFSYLDDTELKRIRTGAKLDDDQDGYIEAVRDEDAGRLWLVQLRGGPHVPVSLDYVPREMRVESVYTLEASSDNITEEKLLAWERLLPTLDSGAVVYHPGGTITSHYGVQCLTHGIPYVTSFEPRVGDVLEPRGDYEHHDYDAVRDGMHAGLWSTKEMTDYDIAEYRAETHTLGSIFAIHNSIVERSLFGSWLLGYSAARLWRMMAMACVGEMRHFRGSHRVLLEWEDAPSYLNASVEPPSWAQEEWKPEPWLDLYLRQYGARHRRNGRESVYSEAWPMHHRELVGCLTASTRSFLTHHWSSGMGGLYWGRAGLSALELYEAMVHISRRPTARALSQLISRANKAVNLVHNGGKLLNKFTNDGKIDDASKLERGVLLNSTVPYLMNAEEDLKRPLALAMEERPRLWRQCVPRDLIKYAKSEDAIRRWDHPSGSATIQAEQQKQQNAALKVGWAFYGMWNEHVNKCILALGEALYRFYTDVVLYEIEQREAEAEALRQQLLKIRAELRKRRKKAGYVEEKPKKTKKSEPKSQVVVDDFEFTMPEPEKVQATTDDWGKWYYSPATPSLKEIKQKQQQALEDMIKAYNLSYNYVPTDEEVPF